MTQRSPHRKWRQMDIYIYILPSKHQKRTKSAEIWEIWGKNTQKQQTYEWSGEEWDICRKTDSTSHKNPTYISHKREREITWDNIMNNYIIRPDPKRESSEGAPVKNSQFFVQKITKMWDKCKMKSQVVVLKYIFQSGLKTSYRNSDLRLYLKNFN